VSALILISFLVAYKVTPWNRVFNVTSDTASQEAGPALAVFVFCLIVTIPLSVVERVQLGYQEGFVSSVWQSIGSLAGLGGVLLAIQLQAGLPWLVLAMAGPPALTVAINWAIQFIWRRPWLCPRWKLVDRNASRKLVNLGSLFLILQAFTVIGSASDNLIIAQIFGASTVAGYAVVQKMFSVALLSQFFVAPLWPAFGEALARNDYPWARRTLLRAVLLSVGMGIMVAVPFLIFGQRIVAFWLGDALIPSLSLLGGFAAYTVLGAYGGAMSSFLNSSFLLRRQVGFYSVASIVAFFLKVMLAWHWQVAGVVWATVLAYGTLYALPAGILSYRTLTTQKKELRKQTHADCS
jgi:O-antigen/teichoic acid export membrane protein